MGNLKNKMQSGYRGSVKFIQNSVYLVKAEKAFSGAKVGLKSVAG
jgi:hypothetical protein